MGAGTKHSTPYTCLCWRVVECDPFSTAMKCRVRTQLLFSELMLLLNATRAVCCVLCVRLGVVHTGPDGAGMVSGWQAKWWHTGVCTGEQVSWDTNSEHGRGIS